MATRRIHQWTDTRQTVGAATATFGDPGAVATPSDSAVGVRVHIVGRDVATGNTVRIELSGAFKNVAGTVSLQGALGTPVNLGNAALIGAVGALATDTNRVTATVVGVVLLTIDWFAHVEWIAYAP